MFTNINEQSTNFIFKYNSKLTHRLRYNIRYHLTNTKFMNTICIFNSKIDGYNIAFFKYNFSKNIFKYRIIQCEKLSPLHRIRDGTETEK